MQLTIQTANKLSIVTKSKWLFVPSLQT